MQASIAIPISKVKLLFMILGALLFVVSSTFILLAPISPDSTGSPLFIKIISVVGLLFFGAGLIILIRKFFDHRAGLLIDKTGITDNSSGVSVGHIPWSDITALGVEEVQKQRFILINTDKPDKYINRAGTLFQRKAMQANHSIYGTPLSINTNSLKIKHKKLKEIMFAAWEEFGKQ